MGFLWLVFLIISFGAIHGSSIDPGGFAGSAVAAGIGACALVITVILLSAWRLVSGKLPKMLTHLRLTPFKKYTVRINAMTKAGRRDLETRLAVLATSRALRQTIRHDPLNDQDWLGAYWACSHACGETLKPIGQRDKEECLDRFKKALIE